MKQNNETMKTVNRNSLLSSKPNRNRLRRRNDQPQQPTTTAASIPLPKSHIQRTPSELQLADATKQAEYENVRMFARLVCGMQSQCLRSGVIHPLTALSLQTIQQTKDANGEEFERRFAEEDDDWELAYDIEAAARIEMEAEYQYQDENSMDTSDHDRNTAKAPTPFAPVVNLPSERSINSNVRMDGEGGIQEKKEEDDDDCVFSFEL